MSLFNVKDFGAVGDGQALDTKALQAAIDACSAGGGTVLVPAGQYVTGTLFLKSDVTLEIEAQAALLGSKDIADYALDIKGHHYDYILPVLIYAENCERLALRGAGTIDGRGGAFMIKDESDQTSKRPTLMRFINCPNLTITGLTLRDAASWCTHLIACDHLHIHGVKIHSHATFNNDGFDIDSCQFVNISDCDIWCGDDAFGLKTTTPRDCSYITITNCVIHTRWAAFRYGPESLGGFRHIAVSNCVIYDTYGCGIKLQMNEGARMENLTFDNLIMENVTGPISMRLAGYLGWYKERKQSLPIGVFRNVTISNVRARVAAGSPMQPYPGEERASINITGSPGYMIENVTLSNVHVEFPGGGTQEEADRRDVPELTDDYPEYFMFGILPAYGLYARHVKGLTLDNVRFSYAERDRRPAVVCDDVEDLELSGFKAQGDAEVEALIRLSGVRGAFIHGSRALTPVPSFVKLEGENEAIVLEANDLRLVKDAGAEAAK